MTTKYDNSGALFKNDKREEGTKQPEYSGSITVEGREYWLSGWIKDGAKGKFFSLAVKPKEANRGAEHRNGKTAEEIDSDIPF